MTSRAERRDALLLATLAHVPFDGWSRAAISAGARDAGVSPEEAGLLFPRGVADMVAHFSDWADRRMEEALAARGPAGLRLRARVALAVRLRLEALEPHREAVRRTLAWLALPPNAALATRLLYRCVDSIWYAVGDRSVDFSFYTKRALLAGIVSSTTLVWLDDRSEGYAETWAFLDRRIDDVMRIPEIRARAARFAGRIICPFRPPRPRHRHAAWNRPLYRREEPPAG